MTFLPQQRSASSSSRFLYYHYSLSVTAMGNVIKVEAGRGNASAIIDHFFPENAEIKVGQSITWHNPTKVGELHTVSIILDNKTLTGPVAPFALNLNSTQFTALHPSSDNERVKVPRYLERV